MSKQTIKIQVIGASATGKTTISREIYYQLKKLGFDVEFDDDEENFEIPSFEQLNATIEKSKISIKTVRERVNLEEYHKQFGQAELDMLDDMIDEDYENRIK